MTYFICKKLTFESSHRLFYEEIEAENNYFVFGKCSNEPSHGHSYKLYIKLKSDILKDGMVVNFSKVKEVATKLIIDKFDHHYINDLMVDLPTAENMCKLFYDILKKEFPQLYSIKLYETETSWAEYQENE